MRDERGNQARAHLAGYSKHAQYPESRGQCNVRCQVWRESDWPDVPHQAGAKDGTILDPFSRETQDMYIGADKQDNEPHVYAVADAAFQALFRGNIMVNSRSVSARWC